MKSLDIGDVSARTGVPPSTLRYYEEIGLIMAIGRKGLRRQFGPEVLMLLNLVALGKMAGFSLAEIKAMFGRDGVPDLPRKTLHAKAGALDQQIRKLSTLSRALRHVAECKAPHHMQCPKFRRIVRMAGQPR